MGASLALAGVGACTRQPAETITPYVRQPEDLVPGKPVFYASSSQLSGYASGVLVETHEGRPTKIEGLQEHPASQGATDLFTQASILGLYDPDRSQTVSFLGEIQPYSAFLGAMQSVLRAQQALGGGGLRFLTQNVTSPTLADQLQGILATLPEARWHRYEPVSGDAALQAATVVFGEPVQTIPRFDRAEVVLSLDADFLGPGPGSLRHVRDFMGQRRLEGSASRLNRLYAIECTPSLTGAKADHRLALRPSQVAGFAAAVASGLGVSVGSLPASDAGHAEWVAAVISDLQSNQGRSLVVAGEHQPPVVHALAHVINDALGNAGKTVIYTDPIVADPVDHRESLQQLMEDIDAKRVDVLVILGGNPVYDAPADFDFQGRLEQVPLRVHLSLYNDETSERCQWHVPEAHYLESWSDARAFDGTASIVQPMIEPLYRGKSAHDVVTAFSDRPERKAHDIVRDYWKSQNLVPEADFEQWWKRSLHDGLIAGTESAPKPVQIRSEWSAEVIPSVPGEGIEVVFRPDPTVYDGRFANNGWLQELPKPLTKLTWDNAALMSIATAQHLGVSFEFGRSGGEHGEVFVDEVEITLQGRSVRAPIWISPGHPDDCITLHLGYGRTRAGNVGTGAGFNAYKLRTSVSNWSGSGAAVRATGERRSLANTQGHWNMEGRDLIRTGTLEEYRSQPDLAPPHFHEIPDDLTLYEPHEYNGYAWGMAIDLNSCTGCSACVVACQSENNIPVVGKEQVAAGREMHWLRVDRYHSGPPEDPQTDFQPLPCMQCENAPCELVCPVAATVHSAEGLNDMVYNRCVGTRYCANNCPYKVRRFNFFLYQDWETPSLKLLRNPDVTVRSRGVMEKCTYCVQRINRAKIQAELEDRSVADGDIRTACQAVCPADAIVFGDINDPESRVSKLKADERNYGLLQEINTRPRTTYLGAVRNTNPDIPLPVESDTDGH